MSPLHITLALSSCVAAFASLGLAMDRHYEDSYGRGKEPAARTRQAFRLIGTAGLLLSLWACVAAVGASQGWVFWFGVMTVSALAVVLLLSYAPRRTMRVLQGGAALALVSGAWAALAR